MSRTYSHWDYLYHEQGQHSSENYRVVGCSVWYILRYGGGYGSIGKPCFALHKNTIVDLVDT